MAQQQPTLGTPKITIAGRVNSATKRTGQNGQSFRTLINTPAPDAYGHPGTFEVRSLHPLGKPGEEITVTCELKGYSRTYDTKDGDKVNTAEHVLQAAA